MSSDLILDSSAFLGVCKVKHSESNTNNLSYSACHVRKKWGVHFSKTHLPPCYILIYEFNNFKLNIVFIYNII